MKEEVLHWYALKVFYNKVFVVEELFHQHSLESYIPLEEVVVQRGDHQKKVRRPVVNSLMFVRASWPALRDLQRKHFHEFCFYMNAEKTAAAVIPDREFNVFRLVTSAIAQGLEYFSDEAMINYSKGERVRVVEGPFAGTEGFVKRIRRDRRVLVVIPGVIAVATTYVPACFLEKIEN